MTSVLAGTQVRRATIVTGVVLVAVAVLWVGAHAYAGDRLPRGTTSAGVSLGGLDRQAAADRLEDRLQPRLKQPFDVVVVGTSHTIEPTAAGLHLDAAATVARAGAVRSWSPRRLLAAITGGSAIDPVVTADPKRLDAAIARLAADTDRPLREGGIDFSSGTAVPVQPQAGIVLDRAAARQGVVTAFLQPGRHVLPATTSAPLVTADAVKQAVDGFGAAAISADIGLSQGGERLVLRSSTVLPFVTMKPGSDGSLAPTVDTESLLTSLGPKLDGFGRPAVNATVSIVGDKPVVVPGVPGLMLATEGLSDAIIGALSDTTGTRTAEVRLTDQQPKVTTDEVKALGIKEIVSEFTTNYPYAPYRVTNIGQAAKRVNGTLLLPGDTFSLNAVVGERTAENGFAEGTIIKDGRFFKDFGGGVSQVATTTFNAMFFAGLKNIEHKPHSFFISRYPEGREATVVWPVVDMKFANDTEFGVLVQTIHKPGQSLTVRMWSTKSRTVSTSKSARYKVSNGGTVYDTSSTCVHQDAVPGFQVDVTRVITEAGAPTRREVFHTVYNAADQVFCKPAPGAAPKPAPTASPTPTAPVVPVD